MAKTILKAPSGAFRVFVVEDDPVYRRMLEYLLKLDPEHEVHLFSSGREALEHIFLRPDVIVLDYMLPDMKGTDVLRSVKQADAEIYVVMVSGQQEIAVAIDLLKQGAYDYLIKNEGDTKDRLLNIIQHIKRNQALRTEVAQLKEELAHNYEFDKTLLGQSASMKRIYSLLQKAAQTDINVTLVGETGTGKEVAAKAIHYNSRRKNAPFVAVNMAAIPRDLAESELFGHEKGAFTGAVARKKGKFELADNGTLFLDEIGEMDPLLQAKLLRVIQERELTRVGGEEKLAFNCRIISATNRSLPDMVAEGTFREDLFYRLMGLHIELPPLRERGQDILLLAKHFLDSFCEQNKMPRLRLSEAARRKLMAHPYPGNVRELKAAMDLAAVMAAAEEVQADEITFQNLRRQMDFIQEELTLEEYTNRIVHHFLEKYEHNVSLVAQKLGIGKSTLYRMLKDERATEPSLAD